ncbi:hypothetical protein OAB57_02990 [Bacteriovoracaceae bacterium]|nr:hypothetical protein [Bacteriovoracaceae bacterium]
MESETEFEVLGHKVKYKIEDGQRLDEGGNAVSIVLSESKKIRELSPQLNDIQVAILAALKLAEEKIELEVQYKKNLKQVNIAAKEATKLLNDIASRNMRQ